MSEKWSFERLNAANEERSKRVKDEWSEDRLKVSLAQTRENWYENYNRIYQESFETLLSEAGWTRNEYCREYDDRIGYDISAGHPAHYMTSAQRLSYGLKMFSTADKHCQVSAEAGRIIVKGTSSMPLDTFLDRFSPSQLFDLERAGWAWKLKHMGFVADV